MKADVVKVEEYTQLQALSDALITAKLYADGHMTKDAYDFRMEILNMHLDKWQVESKEA